jgi:hypothetical protein
MRWWLAGVLVVSACVGAGAPPPASTPVSVACYDAARDIVTRTLPGGCAGEIVDDQRAAEIAEARAQRTRTAAMHAVPAPHPGRQAGSGTGFFVDQAGTILTD